MRITIVGTGYVGLVTGTCLSVTGNEVMCLDIDEKKIEKLKRGELPIYEPGLKDIFTRNAEAGRLKFTTSYEDAVTHASTFFLCLPTPPGEDGSADTRYVLAAAHSLAEALEKVNGKAMAGSSEAADESEYPLFILKSTVPLGTNQNVREEVGKTLTRPFDVASNPEFLKEGAAVQDFSKPDRVVIGAVQDESFDRVSFLYEPFCRTGAPILRMDPVSAELTKYAANGFLATKISFMNEIARICDAYGADVESVRRGISSDPRIGKSFLFPGLGYGGSCFPKDTRALVASAKERGEMISIVDAAEEVNRRQKTIFFPKVMDYLGADAKGKTVALWGLAFKPKTDDIREAPALAMAEKLLAEGVTVRGYDPEAMENVRTQFGDGIDLVGGPYEAVEGADALIVVTEWNEFRSPDWRRVKRLMKTPAVFDGRNIYDPTRMKKMGYRYWGIGRR